MIVFLAVLGPVLGLIGTGLGLWIGHRRGKTESALKEQEAFQGNLRAAYFSLWDVVEDAHLKMRSALDGLTAEVFSGFLADVNNFMIKHGLYIERDDRLLVLEYLFWTNEYLRVLTQSPRGKAAVLASLVHSADQGLEFGDRVRMLEELQERAVELRNQLRARIRQVVGAPPSTAWSPEHGPSKQLLEKLNRLTEDVSKSRPDLGPLLLLPNDSDLNSEWL